MSYRIKEVADLAGISVRTLHYYDEKGLLTPSYVSEAGYRLYEEKDLDRLRQILFFKELDFPLKEIKEILEHPDFNHNQALESHHQLLIKKRQRLDKIIANLEKSMEALKGERHMSQKEKLEGFDMSEFERYKKEYRDEVKARYGGKTLEECEERIKDYSKEKWASIQEEGTETAKRFATFMTEERDVGDKEVQDTVKNYQQYITDNFYNCTPEILKGLGQMYVADERFTSYYERFKEGLAEYVHQAIDYYVDHL